MRNELGIIIVHYNQRQLLLRCLRALRAATKPERTIVTVIDNASSPPLDDKMEQQLQEAFGAGELRVIRNKKNIGFGAACNQGFRSMESEYYCILNPDVEVGQHTLTELLRHQQEQKGVGIVGPRLVYPDGTVQDSYRRFPRLVDQIIKRTPLRTLRLLRPRVRAYLMWDKDKDRTESVDWIVGACWMVRNEALRQTGTFDERFFLFYEDVDLCRRMREKGWKVVYHPAAQALHRHERLSAGGFLSIFTKKTLRIHLISALKYFWKWRRGENGIGNE